MAVIGTMEQYPGPFDPGYTISLTGSCVIGISLNEDDYMSTRGNTEQARNSKVDFNFLINSVPQTFQIGRTFIYQTEQAAKVTSISFPDGAPASLLIDVIYANEYEGN